MTLERMKMKLTGKRKEHLRDSGVYITPYVLQVGECSRIQ